MTTPLTDAELDLVEKLSDPYVVEDGFLRMLAELRELRAIRTANQKSVADALAWMRDEERLAPTPWTRIVAGVIDAARPAILDQAAERVLADCSQGNGGEPCYSCQAIARAVRRG